MTARVLLLAGCIGILAGVPATAAERPLPFRSLMPRFHIPERAQMDLAPYEIILLEDLPYAIDAARENDDLEHRDYLKFAAYAYNLQRWEDSLHFCRRALRFPLEPKNVPLETMGWIQERLGAWPEAIQTWRELAEETIDDRVYRLRVASAFLQLNHVVSARTELEALRPAYPKDPRLNHLLGLCHLKLGDTRQARRYFTVAALQQEPEPTAFLGLAVLSEMADERNEALGWLKKALLAAPHYQRVEFICVDYLAPFYDDPFFLRTLEELDLPADRELALAALPSAKAERELFAQRAGDDMGIQFALRTIGDEQSILYRMTTGYGAAANLSLQRVAYTPPPTRLLISIWPGHNPLQNLWKRVPNPPRQ